MRVQMRAVQALFLSACVFSLSLLPYAGTAQAEDTPAREAIIVDVTSGSILMAKNADERMPTASMSKLMTIYVVFDALKKGEITLNQLMPVSEKAWRMEGSKMFIALGTPVPVEDLIKGVIIQSGNDASVALAEGVAGTEERFAARMNETAKAIGMTNSHFMNATGWPDPNHYSTPRDLATLAYHMITEFPEEYKYYSMREFTWNNITQQNRNPLLGAVEGADGVKTGHTDEAGYGLIGSAKRYGRRVIMVVGGLPDMAARAQEAKRLMEWALTSFTLARLMDAGHDLGTLPIVFGTQKDVAITISKPVVTTIPLGLGAEGIKMTVKAKTPLIAPIKAGDTVGSLHIELANRAPIEVPVVAKDAVVEKGWLALRFDRILQNAKSK